MAQKSRQNPPPNQSERALTVVTSLDDASRALSLCRSDFERVQVLDQARAVEAAAKILDRADIAKQASDLIWLAKQQIVEANPPREKRGEGKKGVAPGNTFSVPPVTIRAWRTDLGAMSRGDLKAKLESSVEPITRSELRKATRPERPVPEDTDRDPFEPDDDDEEGPREPSDLDIATQTIEGLESDLESANGEIRDLKEQLKNAVTAADPKRLARLDNLTAINRTLKGQVSEWQQKCREETRQAKTLKRIVTKLEKLQCTNSP